MCGFPFAPIQILTGDIREGCHARHSRLHDVGRSLPPKSRIERRFESFPGVQRFASLWGTFGSFRTSEKNKIVLPRREIRGFANLDSARPNNNFARTKLNPLPLCLLETWSPCSRPFAILPVSAVSDAQKLATGNFLHVRAATFSYFL